MVRLIVSIAIFLGALSSAGEAQGADIETLPEAELASVTRY